MVAGVYSFTGIGQLFYILLAAIGLVFHLFKVSIRTRKYYYGPILAAVLFTVFAIVSLTTLNAYRIIALDGSISYFDKAYQFTWHRVNCLLHEVHCT